jgi:hypothetical protein
MTNVAIMPEKIKFYLSINVSTAIAMNAREFIVVMVVIRINSAANISKLTSSTAATAFVAGVVVADVSCRRAVA